MILEVKHRLKLLFKQITGFTIYKKLPYGVNPFDEIKIRFKNHSFVLFFDIGANTGQSISRIREYFPNSKIWSFEPIKSTYEKLIENIPDQNIKCFQIGFGSENAELDIYYNKDTTSSTAISFNVKVMDNDKSSLSKERVRIETLDSFCATNEIEQIDYVKIDTEGYDLKVLNGAKNSLKNDRFCFIETEVSMNPENTSHARFEDVKQFLEKFNYRLFGIYEQIHERSNKPILRRVNAVFVSQTIYNTG